MKAPLLAAQNVEGFPLRIACAKHTRATVTSLAITTI